MATEVASSGSAAKTTISNRPNKGWVRIDAGDTSLLIYTGQLIQALKDEGIIDG